MLIPGFRISNNSPELQEATSLAREGPFTRKNYDRLVELSAAETDPRIGDMLEAFIMQIDPEEFGP